MIALVLTIIIIVILASVSINLIFGSNGLITQTQIAKRENDRAYVQEKITIAYAITQTDYTIAGRNMDQVEYYSGAEDGKNNLKTYSEDNTNIQVIDYIDPNDNEKIIELLVSYTGTNYDVFINLENGKVSLENIGNDKISKIEVSATVSDITSLGFKVNANITSNLEISHIYYSIDNGQSYVEGQNINSRTYLFTGLEPNTEYTVIVKVEDVQNKSATSEPIKVNTLNTAEISTTTRYVYDRYTYTTSWQSVGASTGVTLTIGDGYADGLPGQDPTPMYSLNSNVYSSYSFNSSTGTYTGRGRLTNQISNPAYVVSSNQVYEITSSYFVEGSGNKDDYVGRATRVYRPSQVYNKANKVDTVSGTSERSQIQDGYYNELIGQDSIDPIALTYNANILQPGESIELTIWESTNNTYGGNISYVIEVNNNETGWVEENTITQTTTTITIPPDSTSWKVRVKAKDDMGFVSNTYVYGNGIE